MSHNVTDREVRSKREKLDNGLMGRVALRFPVGVWIALCAVMAGVAMALLVAANTLALGEESVYFAMTSVGWICLVLFFGLCFLIGRHTTYAQEVLFQDFARHNDLEYRGLVKKDAGLGQLWSSGDTTSARYVLGDSSFEAGLVSRRIEGGVAREFMSWMYIEVQLRRDTDLHIFLDALFNNHGVIDASAHSSLGVPPALGRLSLEGNFDATFKLYVALDRMREALEVLTPDVMALLIDFSHQFDVEIIGSRLLMYCPSRVSSPNPGDDMKIYITDIEYMTRAAVQLRRKIGRRVGAPTV